MWYEGEIIVHIFMSFKIFLNQCAYELHVFFIKNRKKIHKYQLITPSKFSSSFIFFYYHNFSSKNKLLDSNTFKKQEKKSPRKLFNEHLNQHFRLQIF